MPADRAELPDTRRKPAHDSPGFQVAIPPGDYTQVFANNLQDDPAASGPERQPHANLSRSSGHGVRKYSVDSHRRKAEQEWPEHDEHARGNPAKKRGCVRGAGRMSARRKEGASDRDRAERRAFPMRVWFHGRCASSGESRLGSQEYLDTRNRPPAVG